MNALTEILEVRDRLEIADALYRFGAGIDFNSEERRIQMALATCSIVAWRLFWLT